MTTKDNAQPGDDWVPALEAWRQFATRNPILGLRPGQWQLTNAMRYAREELVRQDAARKVRNRYWVFHRERFPVVMFDVLTGAIEDGRSAQRGVHRRDADAPR